MLYSVEWYTYTLYTNGSINKNKNEENKMQQKRQNQRNTQLIAMENIWEIKWHLISTFDLS